ncbi:MAG: hypothetical protein OXF88_15240, partial [Rhodobacteraceae bacterium]|nr:hypothetical protein [Paracoccaceae bacterium]
ASLNDTEANAPRTTLSTVTDTGKRGSSRRLRPRFHPALASTRLPPCTTVRLPRPPVQGSLQDRGMHGVPRAILPEEMEIQEP